MTILQRFGRALNLKVHIHALVLNGCFTKSPAGRLDFHPVAGLSALDVAEALATAEAGITRLVDRWRSDDAGVMDEAPAVDALAVATSRTSEAEQSFRKRASKGWADLDSCSHHGRRPRSARRSMATRGR